MSITLSEEDMKTFRELATQRTDQSRQKMRLDSELHQKTTFQRKANLTLDETNTFAPDTITYKAVGRMFLQTPIEQIKTELKQKIEESADSVSKIEKKRDYVMKEIKRINEQIQELAPKKKAESKSG